MPALGDQLTASGPYADLLAYGEWRRSTPTSSTSRCSAVFLCPTRRRTASPSSSRRRATRKRRRRSRTTSRATPGASGAAGPAAVTPLEEAIGDGGRLRPRPRPARAALRRRRRQPGRRRPRQHDVHPRGVLPGGGAGRRPSASSTIRARLPKRRTGWGSGAAFHAASTAARRRSFPKRFEAPGKVLAAHDGECVGRRGMAAGRKLELGRSAALEARRHPRRGHLDPPPCLDPMFLEMFGVDIATARSVSVKSRGHFRAGFDEFFRRRTLRGRRRRASPRPSLDRLPLRRVPRPTSRSTPTRRGRRPPGREGSDQRPRLVAREAQRAVDRRRRHHDQDRGERRRGAVLAVDHREVDLDRLVIVLPT